MAKEQEGSKSTNQMQVIQIKVLQVSHLVTTKNTSQMVQIHDSVIKLEMKFQKGEKVICTKRSVTGHKTDEN